MITHPQSYTANSFINGQLWRKACQYGPTPVMTVRPFAETITEFDGIQRPTGQMLNEFSASSATLQERWVAPYTGVATGTFRARWPAGIVSGSCTWNAMTSNGLGNYANTTCNLSAVEQDFTWTFNMVAGTEYMWKIVSSSPILCARPKITAPGGTGIFAGTFNRIDIIPSMLWANGSWDITSSTQPDRGVLVSPYSHLVFDYTGTKLVIEYYNPDVYLGFGYALLGLDADGEPNNVVTPTTANQISVSPELVLPANKRITAYNGPLNGYLGGILIRALYVPATANITFFPEAGAGARLLVIGDSIASGSGSTSAWSKGMFGILRKRYPGIICMDTRGSMTLSGGPTYGPVAMPALGTTPPAVFLTGAPVDFYNFLIEITTLGSRGVAVFRWSSNGGTTYTSNVTTAATCVLGSTGITANFPVGTYATNNSYASLHNANTQGYYVISNAVPDNYTRRASLARWARMRPTEIYTTLGTNDVGYGVSQADFEVALVCHLTDLLRVFPEARIWAQSPIIANNYYVANYINAVNAVNATEAAAGRTARVTHINGPNLCVGQLSDGTHPNDIGHGLRADAIATAMGL